MKSHMQLFFLTTKKALKKRLQCSCNNKVLFIKPNKQAKIEKFHSIGKSNGVAWTFFPGVVRDAKSYFTDINSFVTFDVNIFCYEYNSTNKFSESWGGGGLTQTKALVNLLMFSMLYYPW